VTELTLEELRDVQLGILRAFDAYCREAGLVYHLGFGTLLGAVRHGGYIPWDDDIDVTMPRADYRRLVERFATTAPSHLSVGSPQTRDGWPLPYAKVMDDRTELWEPFEEPVPLGVNIDVFPLDDLPSSPRLLRGQTLVLRFLRWAVELRYIAADRGRGWHHPLAIRVAKPLLRLVPMAWLVGALERTATAGAAEHPGDRVGVRVGSFDWSVPRSALSPPSQVAFEGELFLAPRDPDAVLTEVYGDYRRLPPVHQRVSEHAFTAAWRGTV
jgi:lipopolysaccharide cholinephosphotransferase